MFLLKIFFIHIIFNTSFSFCLEDINELGKKEWTSNIQWNYALITWCDDISSWSCLIFQRVVSLKILSYFIILVCFLGLKKKNIDHHLIEFVIFNAPNSKLSISISSPISKDPFQTLHWLSKCMNLTKTMQTRVAL